MTTLEQFKSADKKVTEIENTLEYDLTGYVPVMIETEEYKSALAESQRLYNELINNGIDPFGN